VIVRRGLTNTFGSVDENTILVCAILGTTYTGQYKDVKEMDRLLGKKNMAEGLSVYIHVDGASDGFVAPFVNPDLEWDFRLVRTRYYPRQQ
jgi:glutamate decarboxylase